MQYLSKTREISHVINFIFFNIIFIRQTCIKSYCIAKINIDDYWNK